MFISARENEKSHFIRMPLPNWPIWYRYEAGFLNPQKKLKPLSTFKIIEGLMIALSMKLTVIHLWDQINLLLLQKGLPQSCFSNFLCELCLANYSKAKWTFSPMDSGKQNSEHDSERVCNEGLWVCVVDFCLVWTVT